MKPFDLLNNGHKTNHGLRFFGKAKLKNQTALCENVMLERIRTCIIHFMETLKKMEKVVIIIIRASAWIEKIKVKKKKKAVVFSNAINNIPVSMNKQFYQQEHFV